MESHHQRKKPLGRKDMTKRRRQSSKKGTPSSESRAEGDSLIEEALSLASSSQDTSNPRDSSRSSINNNRQSGQHRFEEEVEEEVDQEGEDDLRLEHQWPPQTPFT